MLVLSFQLFGGAVVMSYIYYDFFTASRYRIQSLPINTTLYGFSIMFMGTLFSIFLGLIIILTQHWFSMSIGAAFRGHSLSSL